MRYAKLINNYPVYAPSIVRWQDKIVINPASEKLTELGYKPVSLTEPLGEAPEGYEWRATWKETVSEIVQGWEAVEIPPETNISPEEALDILLGGEPS